ncbi:hypothetical protein ACNVED_06750 [Legionella sp. D16C41]|uniref:hypothetical protein n=1 Tax=Legionella sp. D16C41 TaxID=3402688 RepID=UPI003AF50C0F
MYSSIVEIVADQRLESGQDLLIHQLKDYLKSKFAIAFRVDNVPALDNQLCLVTHMTKEEADELKNKIAVTLGNKIAYDYFAENSCFAISGVDLSFLQKKQAEESNQSFTKELVDEFKKMTIEKDRTDDGITNKDDAAPINNAPSMAKQTITKKNFYQEEFILVIKKQLQTSNNLLQIRVEKKPLLNLVLENFSKSKHLAELFLYEAVCRGERSVFTTLLNLKGEGVVEKKSEKRRDVFFLDEGYRKLNTEVKSKRYSYALQANFDVVKFAEYLREKQKSSTVATFLGLQEDVEDCIADIYGKDSSRTKAICQKLQTLNAYTSFDQTFSFN